MSQEKATNKDSGKDSGETRKRLLLGTLGLVLIGTVYLQFFTGDDPAPRPTGAGSASVTKTPAPSPTPRALNPGEKPPPIITQPLEFAWLGNRTSDGIGRNIFVYPPPPTPKPPPPVPPPSPTPPPPIMLTGLNPSGKIGRTGGFMLTILGDKMPNDAQAFFDGRPFPTKFVNANKIEVQISAEAIQRGGNPGVQVRSKGDASLYSNQLPFNVAEPPPPPYKYVGLLTAKSGMTAVLKSQADETEVHTVSKGGKVGTHWRIVSISPQRIEIEDTNIQIIHVINYTAEGN